jgi:putative transposase
MTIDYDNIYIHYVFVTKYRFPFIREEARIRIEKYITGIIANHASRLYSIYANPEHIHMLISRCPRISDVELATRIADASAKFIRENKLCQGRFAWQESGAAFSVSKGHIDRVCKYILNQKEHHRKVSFDQEYRTLMKYYQQTLRWDLAA